MENSYKQVIEDFLQSVYTVSSRRTSLKLAKEILHEAIDSLQDNFPLFKKIEIKQEAIFGGGFQVNFLDDIATIQTGEVARALETLIRIVYDDISENSGLYFVTEIKNHLGKGSITKIVELGIDLDQIQSEQHFAFNRKKRKKESMESGEQKNPLGYTWGSVKKWNYNDKSKHVELYDGEGNLLDKIDVQQAIQRYVENLSGITETSSLELANLLEEHEKAYSFLKLIFHENIDVETAKNMLNLNDDEINKIIKELIELKLLQYTSGDEIEITESGKEFISK
jgi:predicted transcriptional regulator